MALAKYRPSGRFRPILVLLAPAALLLTVLLGWGYEELSAWIPLIYFKILLWFGFAVVVAVLCKLIFRGAASRNRVVATTTGLLIGAAAWIGPSWMQYQRAIDHLAVQYP